MNKLFGKLINGLFYFAIVFSGITIYLIYNAQKNLPEGMCPIDNHREKIALSIILTITYLIADFFFTRHNRKKTSQKENHERNPML